MKAAINRLTAFALALCLSLSLAPAAFAAGGFSDVPAGHWAYEAVSKCAEAGTVTGFADGSFKPNDEVTDVQFLVMLTRTFYNARVEAAKSSETSSWYAPNLKVAEDVQMSLALTITDKPMVRYEMARALYNTIYDFKKNSSTEEELNAAVNSIKDWGSVPKNRTAPVKNCYALGIITGMEDGCFHGEQTMTRAQACVVLTRMMDLLGVASTGTGTLANGQPVTVENVLAIMEEIKAEYPDGTVWGEEGIPGNHYYANNISTGSDMGKLNRKFLGNKGALASLAYGCGGWACMVTDRIFGKTGYPFREVTDPAAVRPGDVVIYVTDKGRLWHYAVAYSTATLSDSYFVNGQPAWTFVACGGNQVIHDIGYVYWDSENNTVGPGCRVFTRYPD